MIRKILRNIARQKMEIRGHKKLNKNRVDAKGHSIGSDFSRNWRKFV